jgi:hypothetical protein
MVGAVSWHSAFPSASAIIPPANVDARHVPAELHIVNRLAEITADWRQVWDELGLKSPSSLRQETKQKIMAEFAEDLSANAKQGDETGDLRRKNSPNIFGRHAYEDYMRKNRAEVVIDVAPKKGVLFDVRIHPPEIHVETHVLLSEK